jgi:hypothetical protein
MARGGLRGRRRLERELRLVSAEILGRLVRTMLTAASTLRRHGGEDYPEAVEGSMSRRCGLVWEAAARAESTSLEYMELASMDWDRDRR